MGGAVPASVWPRATEIFQEGLRLRPTKLYRAGVLQEDVKNLIGDNCRIPDMNWGDIKAMVATVSSCDRRMQEMVRKFGLPTVTEGIDAVLDYAEARSRAAIRKIPDGTYRFTEYMEDDLRSEVPIRLQVALTVSGDSLHLDFTGSDPQVGSALNIASHGVAHPFLCQAINAYLVTEDPGIPKASSILRPVRVTAPPGSVVNAQFPAPIGVRYGTVLRVFDAVLGALAQALPGRVPAAPAGAISPIVASVQDLLTGQRHVQVVEPMLGGGGGRPGMDGLGGADSTSGFLRNTPVESIEAEVPIVMRRYHLMADTGGPGEHRGGLAVRLDFQVYHPHAIVTARGMERFRLEPWGVAGGRAGTSGSCVVNRDTPRARDIGKVDVLHLEPGDVVSIFSPSGGGHGDPRRRDPERVREDVRAGFLTPAARRRATASSSWMESSTTRPPRGGVRPCPRRPRAASTSASVARRWSVAGRPRPGCGAPGAGERPRRRPRLGEAPDLRADPGDRGRAAARPADVEAAWAEIRARLSARARRDARPRNPAAGGPLGHVHAAAAITRSSSSTSAL